MPKKRKPAETFDEHLGDAIESAMNEARLTQSELARRVGMPLSLLGRSIRGSRSLSVNEFERISGAMNVQAHTLAERALLKYGGMEKLLAEHASESEPTNITPMNVRPSRQTDLTTVELDITELAASTDNTPVSPERGEG